jgi:copper chaperone CopZ
MKTRIILILFLFLSTGLSYNVYSQGSSEGTQEVEFKVLGLCGMCKERIEKAAYSVRGVRQASWDQQKQMLTVSFRTNRSNQEDIERAIAKAGHDTENFITDEQTHANLHHCCKYPRDPQMLKDNRLYND